MPPPDSHQLGLRNWNGQPVLAPAEVLSPAWRDELAGVFAGANGRSVLAYGNGRTYGDECLNPGGSLVAMRGLNRVLAFDRERGLLTAEAGLTIRELLALVVPAGWFPPVTPGTSHLTLGGAIANDVHGKDHVTAGTLGRYVLSFELLRSDRGFVRCTPAENAALFRATLGGLGLTGIVSMVTFTLQRIPGARLEVRQRRGDCLAFFEEPADPAFPHRVAWLDASAPTGAFGRGNFSVGRFVAGPPIAGPGVLPAPPLPGGMLNRAIFTLLNQLRFTGPLADEEIQGIDDFFYPLDRLEGWGRAYGPGGFYQHQSLIPVAAGAEPIRELLSIVRAHRQTSFVTVLKQYGDLPSPGLLSFPAAGFSLAMDFPNLGADTLRMLDALDDVVRRVDGRIYPAKDARMSPETFRAGFPRWPELVPQLDPRFASGFARRVGLLAGLT